MGHYRFYELNPSDHITAGYSVECGSDAEAMRAARTLLERAAGVEVWTSNHCVAPRGLTTAPAVHHMKWAARRPRWFIPLPNRRIIEPSRSGSETAYAGAAGSAR